MGVFDSLMHNIPRTDQNQKMFFFLFLHKQWIVAVITLFTSPSNLTLIPLQSWMSLVIHSSDEYFFSQSIQRDKNDNPRVKVLNIEITSMHLFF